MTPTDHDGPAGLLARAQAQQAASRFAEAAALFGARAAAGGDEEEAWFAQWQQARCLLRAGDGAGFVAMALAAFNRRPRRAEPLYDLARYYRDREMYAASVTFSDRGLAIGQPEPGARFVEDFVYRAGLLQEFSIAANHARDPLLKARGQAACNWLALNPADLGGTRGLARWNLIFYCRSASAELPSFAARPDQAAAPASPDVGALGGTAFPGAAVAIDMVIGCGQAVPFDGGTLALLREPSERQGQRYHLHRFAWFDAAGAPGGLTRPFFLHNNGLEAATGLAWADDGHKLLMSYAAAGRAWIASVDAVDVTRLLDPIDRLPKGLPNEERFALRPAATQVIAAPGAAEPRQPDVAPQPQELHVVMRGGLGDALLCTPALRAIKAAAPDCRISFYSAYPDMLAGLPYIAEAHPLAAAPPGATYVNYGPSSPPYAHIAQIIGDQLGVVPHDLRPDCLIDEALVHRFRTAWQGLPRPHILVSRRASGYTQNKDWPDAHWRRLIGRLCADATVIETGAGDMTPAEVAGSYVNLLGRTTLPELIAAIAAADLHVGPISAPMHIAAAARRPSIVIAGGYEHPRGTFYPDNRAFFAPVACAPCWLREPCPYDRACLETISPEAVEQAVREMWAQLGPVEGASRSSA